MLADDIIVVCGIGNSTRGDDACGPYVVEKLFTLKIKGIYPIDCGVAPENFIGKIRKINPKKVIIVDAVDLDVVSGSYEVIDIDKIKGELLSTHKLPVSLFIASIQNDIGCEIEFIGIQPKGLGFCEEMSPECVAGCERIVELILDDV
ncbi:MAG: hydrogenase maturation peptidase HycI [Nanohaloarchaea archaeon]|nr:hydrogenase maturation peptidase HycI [Candidatus Nanohaloarchaea archaeon]